MVTNTLEYSRQYAEKNKEKLKQYVRMKAECEKCGVMVTHGNMKRHQNSMKCKMLTELKAHNIVIN